MADAIKDIVVGDTLVIVQRWNNNKTPHVIYVTAVGRKWIATNRHLKIDKVSLATADNSADVYLSMYHYYQHMTIKKMRSMIAVMIHSNSSGPTDAQVEAVAAILGISVVFPVFELFPAGASLISLREELDTDADGNERVTPAGSKWVINSIDVKNEVWDISCEATQGWILPGKEALLKDFLIAKS